VQQVPSDSPDEEDNGFYREVSKELYNDIGNLAKNLSSTIMDIPAEDRQQKRVELDEADEKIEAAKTQLQDIVKMTEKAAMEIMDSVEKVQEESDEVRDLLSTLKEHSAFTSTGDSGEEEGKAPPSAQAEELASIRNFIDQAQTILAGMQEEGASTETAPPEKKTEKKILYLFDVDVVFQTLYELCTNETVKDHIKAAREKAEEIFDYERFYEAIAPKAATYEADSDNFFNVPMSDVFLSLLAGCKEKAISNLLKKMDKGQSDIFLDQFIPLEKPEIKEVEVEGDEPEEVKAAAPNEDPRLDEAQALLKQGLEAVDALSEKANQDSAEEDGSGCLSHSEKEEIFAQIEEALAKTSVITTDVTTITETLSFQDLSGQQIMKIIKLLSDFQVQLLAIVVTFGSRLKHKEENANITVEESKELAQTDVDSYFSKLTVDKSEGDEAMLDQDTVNSMLEEMGF
jgi:chemotaxis regulatin CheY-phosphate phosphatase CheZ